MSYVKFLHRKASYSAYATMCPFTIQYKYVPYWKCVIHFCLNFPLSKILYEDNRNNIDMPNIKYQVYNEAFRCAVHDQIPLYVTSNFCLYQEMENYESMGKLKKEKYMVLVNTSIKMFIMNIVDPLQTN